MTDTLHRFFHLFSPEASVRQVAGPGTVAVDEVVGKRVPAIGKPVDVALKRALVDMVRPPLRQCGGLPPEAGPVQPLIPGAVQQIGHQ